MESQLISDLLQHLLLVPMVLLWFLPMRHYLAMPAERLALLWGAVLLVLIPLSAWLTTCTGLSLNFCALFFAPLLFLLYRRSLRAEFWKSLSFFMLVIAIMYFTLNYSIAFDAWVHPGGMPTRPSLRGAVFHLGLGWGFCFTLGPLLYLFGSQLADRLENPLVWSTFIPTSVLHILVNIAVQPKHYRGLYAGNNYIFYLVFISLSFSSLLLTWIIFYYDALLLIQGADQKEELQLLRQQERQYAIQRRHYETVRRLRHDLRQSIYMLNTLAKKGDLPAIRAYLSEYMHSFPEAELHHYSSNPYLDALLNYYAGQYQKAAIRMNWQIDYSVSLSGAVSVVDLCGMLGNVLENVLNACMQLPEESRRHAFSMRQQQDELYIVSENSCADTAQRQDSRSKGRFESEDGHGIGLSSIQVTARKYHGFAQFSQSAGEFQIDIMLKL